MSHSNTDQSQRVDTQTSWMPVPEDDSSEFREQATTTAHSTRHRASSRNAEEREGLLKTENVRMQRNSLSFTSSRVSAVKAAGPTKASECEPNYKQANVSSYDEADLGKVKIEESGSYGPFNWLPYTLRRPYLVILAFCALALAVVLMVLCYYSTHHYGLTTDNGSVGQQVAKRYVPTVLAVLFTLSVTMIAEDVKRTEAFARMARPEPIAANHTLFYIPKVWWKSAFTALSPKRGGGHRRWILSLSSLAAGISVLVISTFSSSVFVTRDVVIQSGLQLQRYTPQQNGSIILLPKRDTYTRAISGFLYNATTSLWVSDSHVVLPFTTPGTNPPILQDGTWAAKTKVLKMESTCAPLKLIEKTDINVTFTSAGDSDCNGTCYKSSKGLKLQSEDGCVVQLQTPIAVTIEEGGGSVISDPIDGYFTDILALQGGMMWTNLSSAYVSWQDLIEEYGQNPRIDSGGSAVLDQWRRTFVYGFSDQCRSRDLLFVSPPWFAERLIPSPPSWQKDYWANFTARAEICTPKYTEADIAVTAVIGGAAPRVYFDESDFEQHAKPASNELVNVDRLNEIAFGDAWLKYFPAPAGNSDVEGFEGVSMLLAKVFSLKIANLLSNATLASEASKLRTRFFGELISSSVLEAFPTIVDEIDGKFLETKNRLIVIPGVAVALAVLLSLAACYSLAMLWLASNHRRPLNLRSDPSAITGIVPLMDITSSAAADFRMWTEHERTQIQSRIGHVQYSLYSGRLSEENSGHDKETSEAANPKTKGLAWARIPKSMRKQSARTDWRPSLLHKIWLSSLLLVIIAVAIAMLVLRKFADEQVLFQKSFVQQVNLSLFHASFSPHSLIATLIAVLIGLCWDSVDKAMRTLQPYLAMSKEPSEPSRGISISYESSYWIWATIKSARLRHWLLCLVTIGTTLSQILVISMAAVFERHTVIHTQTTNAKNIETIRSLTIKQEPFDFNIGIGQRPFYVTDGLLETSETNWLYRALDDITLQTPALPWTKDEWVFTPVNLTNLDDQSVLYVATQGESEAQSNAASFTSSFNVSLTTSALRSRLECQAVIVEDWMDDIDDVYPNRFDKSATGHVLPMKISTSGNFTAPVLSAPRRLACCTSATDQSNKSVVAYWSSGNAVYDQRPAVSVDLSQPEDTKVPSGWTKDFAVKWIVGSAASATVPGSESKFMSNSIGLANESILYFDEEPQISILKCSPVIEQVNASITFARDTSQILEYELLGDSQPAIGAWDYAYDVVYESQGGNMSRGNVSYGAFFISQLLTAPHIVEPQMRSSMMVANHTIENLAAERFALRDTDKGTNMDYMSYANFVLANKDPTALLNTTLLQTHSEKTFQTFFKHFVTGANWTYGGSASRAAYEYHEAYWAQNEKFDGVITERIEVLSMNKVATWLSLAILFLLMIILGILIIALQVVYPHTSILRRVECLADALAMVAGSDELARWVNEVGVEGMERAGIKTRLGWFRDKRGVVRWGVEVVDGNVEWVDGPEQQVGERSS